MDVPKLTKNEIRFSKLIRPTIGDVIEFSPVIILCNGVTARMEMSKGAFIKDWMVEGAKCKVVDNLENIVVVQGIEDPDVDIISPEFLIKRDLTDEAMKAINVLKKALSITN